MINNYVKSTFKSLKYNRGSFIINVVGLSIGLGSCIIILLWLNNEIRYNDYLKKNIYQVITNYKLNGGVQSVRSASFPIINLLSSKIPEIQNVGFIKSAPEEFSVTYNNTELTADGRLVSSNLLSIINRPFLYGNPNQALNSPLSIVISSALANKIFGKDWKSKIQNQSLTIGKTKELEITGVYEDFPKESTVHFDYCMPIDINPTDNIGNLNYDTYIEVNDRVKPNIIERKVNGLLKKLTTSQIVIQPFKDIYLYSNFNDGKIDGGRIEYVKLFSVTAVFLIFIACINFMNLYTASSFKRTKEIGVRRVLGSNRSSIIMRLLFEALIITCISGCIAVFLTWLFLPYINNNLGVTLDFPMTSVSFWLVILVLLIVTGLLSGCYPAILLTSFSPIKILNKSRDIKIGGIGLRNALFVFQFFISVLLIIVSAGMSHQISFLKDKKLGYDKKNIVYKKLSQNEIMHLIEIKNRLLNHSSILSATTSSADLQTGGPMVGDVDWPGKAITNDNNKNLFTVIFSDKDFITTLKIPLLKGAYSNTSATGNIPILLNEKAAEIIGGGGSVIGKTIKVWNSSGQIVGIVKDFHFNSLFSPIEPLIIANVPSETGYLVLRVQQGRQREAINLLNQIHNDYSPNKLFDYRWLDVQLDTIYKSESNMEKIAIGFSLLSVLVAILGLFGLANLSVERKIKEFSIRKVIGATMKDIVILMFKDFTKLILISIILAIPISIYLLGLWTKKFAYKSDFSILSYLYPISLLFLVTACILIYHSIRVNFVNPVKILKEQ